MTISSNTRQAGPFTGNGSAATFAFTFKVFDEADLVVIKTTTATGTDATLTITTDYTVDLNENQNTSPGGSVTLTAGVLATGYKLTVTSDIDNQQPIDLTNQGGFYPSVINDALDRVTIQVQQVDNAVERSVKFPISDGVSGDILLPSIDVRKGTVLAFNESTGLPEAGPDISATSTVAGNAAAINTVAGQIDPVNNVGTVAGIAGDVGSVANIESDVTTVAGISSDVTAVAADATDIGTVSTNIADVNTVAGISANVTTVAGNNADVTTCATNIAAIVAAPTEASNAATSATASAASASAASTSASNASTSETNAATSATAAAASETAAASSATAAASSATTATTQATTATTQATAAASSATAAASSATAASTSETNAATSETNAATSATNAATSATNAASSATAAAASQVAAAASAASAATTYDAFDDRYLGVKASDPTVDNDGDPLVEGMLYFSSTANEMRVYDGANWIAASSAGGASLYDYHYTATASQTAFTGADDNANTLSYTVDNLIVTLNGIVLENGTDYTATDGSTITLTTGAALNDELNVVAFKSFTTADMVSATNGGTFSGNVDFGAGIDVTGNITVTGTVDGVDLANVVQDSDIGVTVQAYDATIVVDADIGSTVQAYDADTAKLDVAQSWTAAQTFTDEVNVSLISENVSSSATAATGTINFDVLTNQVLYYSTDASGNWTLNVRGDASNTLNSVMATGESLTIAFLVAQGATPYYQSAFTIDGSSVTPKWQGGSAPTAGNANSIDSYSVTIFKEGDAAFTAFEGQVQYA